jgi:hypothetical protein
MSTNQPSYVKLDPQPPWARFQDIIVQLDTDALIAVGIETMAELTGATHVNARARAVDADGNTLRDAAGLPITTQVSHPYEMSDLTAKGLRVVDLQRDCVRVVLGEPTVHFFIGADTAGCRARASIRLRLAQAQDA